ncbi:hypothetical protein Tco_0937312 [Tanacetum coccineum]|uniref:Uncharacterized protein n=1 Tax=Tanacetum coccineum TaxID=301880 RepID=A0ABQ5DF06_9ASTR
MSTQQDIYAAGSENRPPMLNKDNYVPWSSRLLRYAKSKPNGKLIYNSIMNGPYVRRMIPEPGDSDCEVPVAESFHEQTDDELTEKEITTLPVRPTSPSPDRTSALYGYLLDSGDDSSEEDLNDTAESLHTQYASTSVVHPSPTRSLSTSLVLASQPGKEIPMPLGYKAAMNRWRAAPSSIWYPLLSSELPLLSHKRSRPLSPSLPPLVPPPPEHSKLVRDNIEASIWNLERHAGP